MSLQAILEILPREYNDHRDIHPLVHLITGGYVDSAMTHDGKDICQAKNRDLAITGCNPPSRKGSGRFCGFPVFVPLAVEYRQ
ncbi:hypothetical protein JW916_06095, partial [Candidatus Sumerlaeota bacterium]|nr:hypothetical protein [Candidatus Sumerlaeota bacterium]